jgi:hypothetical protein
MLARLREEMPRWDSAVTPPGAVAADHVHVQGPGAGGGAVAQANVNARVGRNFIRLSPSVYNDMADIDVVGAFA